MIDMDRLVIYFPISFPGMEEIAVYPDQYANEAALIAFSGTRATSIHIPEFSEYLTRTYPCVCWARVPIEIVEKFLAANLRG